MKVRLKLILVPRNKFIPGTKMLINCVSTGIVYNRLNSETPCKLKENASNRRKKARFFDFDSEKCVLFFCCSSLRCVDSSCN